ncbi:MAG: Nicotinamide riboside transporter pnuC [Bacteroidetes bacterium]|nr:Nicotinamide riboside transporter pnuC [Bacteroidota bacterium]
MIHFKKINTLKPFDWFLILGIVTTNIIYSVLAGEFDIIGSVAGVTGVVCVVLAAKGNILNYIFGLINVALFAWISYKADLLGGAALNALYYLPMQFIGWYTWIKKRDSEESVTVVAKRLNLSQRLLLAGVSAVFVIAVAYILFLFKDPQPLKDSATTVLSVIAMFLMVRAFMEQWTLWVAVNFISVVIWVIAFANGEAHSMLMVIMWMFYLVNSVSGWISWLRLSKKDHLPDLK